MNEQQIHRAPRRTVEPEQLKRELARERAVRKQAEAELAQYQQLFSAVSDVIIATDRHGRITSWNPAAEMMYGWRAEEVVGRYVWIAVPTEAPYGTEEVLRNLRRRRRWHGEVIQRPRTGQALICELTIMAILDEGGHAGGYVFVAHDVTDRKRAERSLHDLTEVLQRHTRRLQIMHDIDHAVLSATSSAEIAQIAVCHIRQLIPCARASVALFDFDAAEARLLAVDTDSPSMLASGARFPLDIFGVPEDLEQTGGRAVDDLLTLAHPAAVDRMLLTEGIRTHVGFPISVGPRLGGALSLGARETGAFTPEHEQVAHHIAHSLSVALQNTRLHDEISASRHQLQCLSRRMAQVREHERADIAHELYDDAGQRLAAIMVRLKLLERDAVITPPVAASIGEMKSLVDEALADLHHLAVRLRPASLDRVGLMPALRQYAEQFSRQFALPVSVEEAGLAGHRFSPETETLLYRAVQEALSNTVRHAQARHVGVIVQRLGDAVSVIIEDDGVGLEPETAMKAGGLGLFGTRERVEELGGSLIVESAPGSGTAVFIRIPGQFPLGVGNPLDTLTPHPACGGRNGLDTAQHPGNT